MKASLSNAVYLFAAPLSQFAATVDALRAKVEEQGGAAAAAPAEAAQDAAASQDAEAAQDAPAPAAPQDTDTPAEDSATAAVAEGGDAS